MNYAKSLIINSDESIIDIEKLSIKFISIIELIIFTRKNYGNII